MNYVFSSNEDTNVFHPSPYTKKSIVELFKKTKSKHAKEEFFKIYIDFPRSELIDKISHRTQEMIKKAISFDSENTYHCADLVDWIPNNKVDLVHSMEVFYYVKDPIGLIHRMASHWIKPGGRLIVGIDYYSENETSRSWNKECGISIMTRLSEAEWLSGFNSSGMIDVICWREGAKDNWAGTLVITGRMQY